MIEPDVNLAIGAEVAATLYGSAIPVLMVSPEDFATIASWPTANIGENGSITPASP
jgi:hypothetical protein